MKRRNSKFRSELVPIAFTFLLATNVAFAQEVDLKSHTALADNTYVQMPPVVDVDFVNADNSDLQSKDKDTNKQDQNNPETDKVAETETVVDLETETVADLETEKVTNPEAEPVAETEKVTDPETVVDLETETVTDPEKVADLETEKVTNPEAETVAETEKVTEPDTTTTLAKDENKKQVEALKAKIDLKHSEVKELHTEVLESKVVTINEKDDLEQKANDFKSDLEDLNKSANNISDYEGCEEDEKSLKDAIKKSEDINNETIKLLTLLEERGIESDLDEDKKEKLTSEQKDEKISDLENHICEQEDELKKLQDQVSALSQNSAMAAMMPYMMMQMMQQNMALMSQFTMAPSVLDNTQHLSSLMMMSAINNMNMTSNFGMMGMMNALSGLGQQQNPMSPNYPMVMQTQVPNFGYNFGNVNSGQRAEPSIQNAQTAGKIDFNTGMGS